MAQPFDPLNYAEENNETSWYTSAIAGIGSGLIKVPEGVVSLAAELIDLGADTNTAAGVEKFFDDLNPFDEVADATAAGRITEAITSIAIPGTAGFKFGKAAATAIGYRLAKKAVQARKSGDYARITRNTSRGAEEALKRNRKARAKRFVAGVMGGAAGETFVADVEEIGTFGDVFEGSPTSLNTFEETGREDAARKLANRLKFGAESILITPAVYGVGKSAKLLAQQGRELAYSNSRFKRLLNKVASAVRPRERLTPEAFDEFTRLEGLKARDANRAKELFSNFTKEVNKVFPEIKTYYDKSLQTEKETFLKQLNDILLEGDLTKPANKEKLETLIDSLKTKNLDEVSRVKILESINGARSEFSNLVGIIERNSDSAVSATKNKKELGEILKERLKNYIGTTYKIFEDKSVLGYKRYKPTDEAYNATVQVVRKSLTETGNTNTKQSAEQIVDEILGQVNKMKRPPAMPFKSYDKVTMAGEPEKAFQSFVELGGTVEVLGNKIVIKEADKKVFKQLFGQIKDPRYTLFNGMGTLSSLARTSSYLQTLKTSNDEVQKRLGKQSGFFWGTEAEAKAATNGVADIVPANSLMEEITEKSGMANPLAGKFTTREIAEGFANAHNIQGKMNGLGAIIKPDGTNVALNTASLLYRSLMLFPKGVSQIAKTVLSIPTHLRNYISAAAFSAANGLMFNPGLVKQGFEEALGGLGPRQLSGIFKFGEKTTPQMEETYRELLDLGVVNSQVQIGDLKNLFRDMGFGASGFDIDSGLKPMMSKLKGLFGKFQGQYIAEDDFFKILNYAGEFGRLKTVFKNKVGLKEGDKVIDYLGREVRFGDDFLKKEAANIVKNTVPNYAFVGQYVKLARRLPFGNFMSFPSEMIRTSSNVAAQAVKEMKHSRPTRGSNILPVVYEIGKGFVKNDNPFYGIGFKRMSGMATTLTVFPTTIVEGAKALYDVSEDEIQAMRQFVPEWSKNSTLIPSRDEDSGELYYTDLSHSLAYDVIAKPFRTMILNVQQGQMDGDTLLLSFTKGMDDAAAEIASPFIDESIWTEAAADISFRGGRTKEGRQLYTDQTSFGDKQQIRFRHLVEALAPSYKQFLRLGQAGLELPTKTGDILELDKEIPGIIGFRPIKLDPIRSMNFKIAEYQTGLRNARREFTGGFFGLLKGGPIDGQDIISRYIASNKARFNVQKEMFKNVRAAGVLGVEGTDLRRVFKDRQISSRSFNKLRNGLFDPYFPSRDILSKFREIGNNLGTISPFAEVAPDVRDLRSDYREIELGTKPSFATGGPVGNNVSEVVSIIREINEDINDLELSGDFNINITDYVPIQQKVNVATGQSVLPQTPMPNAQVIQPQAPGNIMATGLTPVENALLSDEEKQIRLRQRGLA